MAKQGASKKRDKIEKILNHQVQGEVYIQTPGRIWKALVLKNFNRFQSGELGIMELIEYLETKGGVKFNQKPSLVKYPIEECLQYIAKIANKQLSNKDESS